MRKTTASTDEFSAVAEEFAHSLAPREEGATVVALSGDLGAGKTTFVQTVAKVLGVEEVVTSPTFVIEKIYLLKGQEFQRLVHIDAFRLKGEHHLELLGWRELVADAGTLIFLEWPEKVPGLIPEYAYRIQIDIQGHQRIISSDGSEEKGEKE